MIDEATRIMSDAEMDAADRLVESRLSEARTAKQDPDTTTRVREYMKRPYRMEVHGDPEDGYLAEAPELPGCITAGETPAEAIAMLRDAMESWIEAAIIAGDPVPLPEQERYSGRILLRMPKSLHAHLAEQAKHENVSINQLATTLLAEGIGREQGALWLEVRRALDTSGLPPGPDVDIRYMVRDMIRFLAAEKHWDPSADAPGSPHTALLNSLLRFWFSLPPQVIEEVKRRLEMIEPSPADRSRTLTDR